MGKDDNCPSTPNLDQSDQDADGDGDDCDSTPGGPDGTTNFGVCGASAGKSAIVLESVSPLSVCPGDTIQVTYEAALKECIIGPILTFKAFVSGTGNDGGVFDGDGRTIGTDTSLSKTKSIELPGNLAPNDYFVEVSYTSLGSTTVRSKRLPLTVRGKGVTADLFVPEPVLREQSPYAGKLTVTAGTTYRVLSGGTQLASGTGTGSETALSVPFTQAGNTTITVELDSPDGCVVERTFTYEVLSCDPKLESNTKTTPNADMTLTNVWVCASSTYAGTSKHVYLQPTGTFGGKTNLSGVLWLPSGGVLGAGMTGSWTILHAGPAPTLPSGVKGTLIACPSMTYDTSAVIAKCL